MEDKEYLLAVTCDEVPWVGALLRRGKVTDEANNGILSGGQSLDIVWLVVCVGAWESLASREGRLALFWVHHLDAIVVVRVDNGRDVKVVVALPSVPGDLTKHTRDIRSSLGDGVPVSNPAIWEGDRLVTVTRESDAADGR